MQLGTKIRYMLNEKNITQESFEQTTGINRTTLMPNAHRRSRWRKTTMYAAACFFGISVEDLVKGTEMEDQI